MRTLTLRRKSAAARIGGSLAALAVATAACSSSTSGPGGSSGSASELNIIASPIGPFANGFNPFSLSTSAYSQGAIGMIYEPLMQYNLLKVGQIYPWLATSWSWANGGTELVLHTRTGVKWSDGKPFSAADVAFTFNLIKKFPALNVNGVTFTGATAPSATEAILKFPSAAYRQLFAVSQVLMAPEHVWSHISNPVTFANDTPVGTGPYLAGTFTPQEFTLVKNPHYWQAGLPKIATLRFQAYADNPSAGLVISTGKIDWNTVGMLNYQTGFVDKNPAQNHESISPIGDWYVCPNLARSPFNQVAVRKALSISFDRNTIQTQGEHGFYPAMNTPTGLTLPRWQSFLAPRFASLTESFNPSAAKAMLEKAGFKPGSNGMLNMPNGKPFALTLLGPAPYNDWMTDLQLMSSEMAQAGIKATVRGESVSAWTNDVNTGNYDLTFCGQFITNDPYSIYNYLMNSALTAPIGKTATANVERFKSAQADAALKAAAAAATTAQQLKAYTALESIMVNQVPVIPLFNGGSWAGYTTTHAVGWPSAANPYEMNAVESPWDAVVVLHLKPAG